MLTAPRLLFAMAEQGQLPGWLATVHPRFRTPYVAIGITAGLQLLLAVTGTFLYALTLSTIIRLSYFALTSAALPVLRQRADRSRSGRPLVPAPADAVPPAQFRVAGGWLVSGLAVALCIWLLSNSSAREARDVAIAGGVGLLIYEYRRRLTA